MPRESVTRQAVQRRKEAEEAAGVEKVDVFGRHIKAKRVDGSYRAMESADKVSVRAKDLLATRKHHIKT